ncbi:MULTISPECIES: DUF3817 domain-containing protein [unclassified Nocardioides]|uniref:DUF3817 domain-containing protein n=1 Tax=unclassified Nocardioides TaxID=2615069 RepID=UPI0007027D0F|nr:MULTISPECIES: DUF3817 domain-containing protein [unclassified Nocardioides]KRC53340.1 hypothetical protein ASE19_13390 [Nocardioides sp. Root79]KRC70677.1 hypothetical protein ASE20_12235 [Nocardioides sp. Root240]
MTKLFPVYRVLALVVGVLLLVGTLDALLKYGHHIIAADSWAVGSDLQQFGEDFAWIWMFHGFIYIAYVVVAFLLSTAARWSLPQLALLLIAGLVPGLIFWVEHRVAARLREEHPELART